MWFEFARETTEEAGKETKTSKQIVVNAKRTWRSSSWLASKLRGTQKWHERFWLTGWQKTLSSVLCRGEMNAPVGLWSVIFKNRAVPALMMQDTSRRNCCTSALHQQPVLINQDSWEKERNRLWITSAEVTLWQTVKILLVLCGVSRLEDECRWEGTC